MVWRKATFVEALKSFLKEFEENANIHRMALVWRTPDEWNVLDEWLIGQIQKNFDGSTLRIVMWLTREEAAQLVSVFREVK